MNRVMKLGKLNHVAMAVPDLESSALQWKSVFGKHYSVTSLSLSDLFMKVQRSVIL